MANRYWVGGTATWDATAGTKWSTTSGGAGGAAVPTASDDVFFNGASGVVTCTISGSRTCLSLNCNGFDGTLTGTSTPVLTVSGNITLDADMTAGNVDIVCNSTTSRTITSAGKTFSSFTFDGVGGSWALQDSLTVDDSVTLTRGTLNLNNFTLTPRTFYSDNSNTRTLAFGTTGVVALAREFISSTRTDWDCPTITGLTVTGTPTVTLSYTVLVFNSETVIVDHGSTAGASESNAINITTVGAGSGTTLEYSLIGGFKNVNFSSITRSETSLDNNTRSIYGNLTLSAGMSIASGSAVTTLAATSGTQDITSNGATINFPLTQAGAGGTVRLLDALTLGSTRAYTLTNGTFNANNFAVTVGAFSSSNSNTRTLTMGSGAWTLSGTTGSVWDTTTTTGLTFNKDTANITLSATGTTTRTFAGGNLTYNNLVIGGSTGASTLTFAGDSTFGTISSTKTVAQTILFTPGTTTTVANWTVTGSAGNVLTIGSVGGAAQHTLAKTGGGTVTVEYASISYSNATPANTWAATNSTNGGNNNGWTFLQGSGFFLFF
jgi:hypothetical protein